MVSGFAMATSGRSEQNGLLDAELQDFMHRAIDSRIQEVYAQIEFEKGKRLELQETVQSIQFRLSGLEESRLPSQPQSKPVRTVTGGEACIFDSADFARRVQAMVQETGYYRSVSTMERLPRHECEFYHQELPDNTWGLAIMLLTRKRHEWHVNEVTLEFYARLIYCCLCVLTSLVFQLGLVYSVHKYAVGYAVFQLQGTYAEFHREVFDQTGEFLDHTWNSWDGKREKLCDAVIQNKMFLCGFLFLWFGNMAAEVKTIFRLIRNVNRLPGAPSSATIRHCVIPGAGDSGISALVVAMSRGTRLWVYILVVFPQLVICAVLAILGAQWLTATRSYGELILNSLALDFILKIDEFFVDFLLPHKVASILENTKLAYIMSDDDLDAGLADYSRSFAYFVITMLVTISWAFYWQQVLPFGGADISQHCGEWYMNQYIPKCRPFETGCFPFGDVPAAIDYSVHRPSD